MATELRQLGGQDASFVYNEAPRMPQHIGGFSIYDPSTAPGGAVTFKGILEHIRSRMALVNSFRDRLVRVPFDLGHPYWAVDPDFDLEFHVRHIALPKPGDWRQLCIQVARLHARELDLSRPLWEMYVVEGLDNVEGVPAGSFALVSKTHHAAIDGVSGADITAIIHDLTPDAPPPETPTLEEPGPLPSPYDLAFRATVSNITQPWRYARFLRRNMPQLRALQPQNQEQRQQPQAPRTRFSGVVTAHRVVEGRSFDLTEIRRMKSAVEGATVNDAILAIVAGGMRRYLESKNELPAEPLICMAPISIRSESEKGALGNRVSAMMVALPTNVADPLERLRQVHQTTLESKAAAGAIPADVLMDANEFIPFALAGVAARAASRLQLANRTAPVINTVVTNVPGPQMPLYFAGAKMLKTFGMGPVADGLGMMHPVFSYNGEISVSVTACREMMPDPEFYAQCLQDSFDELSAATGAPASSAPRKRAATKQA
jgi:diacylglycerol O-acyltransferase / wax synthase